MIDCFKCLVICLTMMTMSLANECYGQQYHVDVGIRCQKTIGLYFENGIASQWSLDQLANQRLYLGLGFVSSRLGSALGTNAIKQDNYQIWLAYYFRKDKKLRSFASLNSGYFIANYEEEIFDVLDNSSMLLSGSSGVEYTLPLKLKLNAAIGYNLISGNGEEGPGTLYPLFAQFTVYYPLR